MKAEMTQTFWHAVCVYTCPSEHSVTNRFCTLYRSITKVTVSDHDVVQENNIAFTLTFFTALVPDMWNTAISYSPILTRIVPVFLTCLHGYQCTMHCHSPVYISLQEHKTSKILQRIYSQGIPGESVFRAALKFTAVVNSPVTFCLSNTFLQ